MSPVPWMMSHQTLRRGNHDPNRQCIQPHCWPWTSLWYNFHRIMEGGVSSWFLLRIQFSEFPSKSQEARYLGQVRAGVAKGRIRPVHFAFPKSGNVLECEENFSAVGQSRVQEQAALSFSLSISFSKAIFFPPVNESLQPKQRSLERKN